MNIRRVFLICVLVISAEHAFANAIVARVLGTTIWSDSIRLKLDGQNRPILPEMGGVMRGNRNPIDMLIMTSVGIVQESWLTERRLRATEEELREYHAWVKRSGTKQIAQDKAQLAMLQKSKNGKKLKGSAKTEALEQQQSLKNTIAKNTQRAANEAKFTERDMRAAYGREVERWKFYKELYRQYGGDVNEAGSMGFIPVGAIERLMLEHNKRGQIEIMDPTLRAVYWQRLGKKAPTPVPPEKIDWTPFWKK